ncbi:MAG: hypothetical protein R3C11_05590 [Planctomycetaceae bacterium]
MRYLTSFLCLFLLTCTSLFAADPVNTYNGVTSPLWEGEPPHSKGTTEADIPELTLHVPLQIKKSIARNCLPRWGATVTP